LKPKESKKKAQIQSFPGLFLATKGIIPRNQAGSGSIVVKDGGTSIVSDGRQYPKKRRSRRRDSAEQARKIAHPGRRTPFASSGTDAKYFEGKISAKSALYVQDSPEYRFEGSQGAFFSAIKSRR